MFPNATIDRILRLGPKRDRSSVEVWSADRGTVIVGVLWTLIVLALVVGSLSKVTRSEAFIGRNSVSSLNARMLADAGAYRAIMEISLPPAERIWSIDGQPTNLASGGGSIEITIRNAAGKVDINRAPAELLSALISGLGIDETEAATIADRIIDFRDRDDKARPNGAETSAYAAQGVSTRPSNRPYVTVDQVRHVLGMTADLYSRLRPLITVYGERSSINPVVADQAVLAALPGVDNELASTMTATTTDSSTTGGEIGALLPAEARNYVGFSLTRVYTISVRAETMNGSLFERRAVVKNTGNREIPYEILEWSRVYDISD